MFFLFLLDSLSESSFSRRPHVNVFVSLLLLVVDLCSEEVSLVVAVVVLLSVCEMAVSELSDLRRARRNRSRIAIVVVYCVCPMYTAGLKRDWEFCR